MMSSRSTPASSEHGLAAIALVLVISWALTAVFMLSRTIVAAQQIDRRVAFVTTQTGPIDDNLDAIELAQETGEIAEDISSAAAPLSGHLDDVVSSARSIDSTGQDILATVGAIGDDVDEIAATAGEISASVDDIHGNFSELLPVVRSIDDRVAGINRRADDATDVVSAIERDTGDILAELGPGHGTPADAGIHGHANSIDCSPLVAPRSRHCEQ